MADACLAAIGVETSAAAVGAHYGPGLLDGWLVDDQDKDAVDAPGTGRDRGPGRPLYMTDVAASAEIARAAIDLALELRAVTASGSRPARAQLTVLPVTGLPEITAGDDLAALIAEAAAGRTRPAPTATSWSITSKIVSKAEDRVVAGDRDAAIDAETVRVVARRGPTTISQTRHGLVLAAAGVDESNTEPGTLVLLPVDPDGSARTAAQGDQRASGARLGVLITDTMGRPWRAGQTDTAIGAAGVMPLRDHRGQPDTFGNLLEVTVAAVADEIAAAADLIKQKTTGVPVAIVRGLADLVTDAAGPGAAAMIRPAEEDMFRLGAADVLTARRTVREFSPAPVSPDAVRRAIAAAITAPAPASQSAVAIRRAGDRQQARTRLLDDMLAAWKADLAADGFTPEQIARRVQRGEPLRRAPLIIVPCLVADAAHAYPDARRNASERAMFLVAMGAAIENLLVALAVDGLGSCWISSTLFCREVTTRALGVPADWEPMGAIGVGHRGRARPGPARPRPRRVHPAALGPAMSVVISLSARIGSAAGGLPPGSLTKEPARAGDARAPETPVPETPAPRMAASAGPPPPGRARRAACEPCCAGTLRSGGCGQRGCCRSPATASASSHSCCTPPSISAAASRSRCC